MGRSWADNCGGVVCVCQEQRILDLLVESSINVKTSCRMFDQQTWAWWKQVEGKNTDDLRMLGGLIFMSMWRYLGSVIWRRLCNRVCIRCSTLSQWRDWSTREMWKCLGVWVTARTSPFWICWKRLIWMMNYLDMYNDVYIFKLRSF